MKAPTINPQSITLAVTPDDLQQFIDKAVTKALEQHTAKQQPPANDLERLSTISDLEERFQVSRIAVWQWRKKGLLKATRIGNSVRFREADILEFIQQYNR